MNFEAGSLFWLLSYCSALLWRFFEVSTVVLTEVMGLQQDPNLSNYMSTLQNPAAQNELAQKMNELKEDPELAPILKEIEEMGPSAMMK